MAFKERVMLADAADDIILFFHSLCVIQKRTRERESVHPKAISKCSRLIFIR